MCVLYGASENVFCVNYEFIRHVGLDVLYRTQFSSSGHMHTHVGYHIEWKMCDMFYFLFLVKMRRISNWARTEEGRRENFSMLKRLEIPAHQNPFRM